MFELANRIAYDGNMVYGTIAPRPDRETPAHLPTGWLNATGSAPAATRRITILSASQTGNARRSSQGRRQHPYLSGRPSGWRRAWIWNENVPNL